MEGLALHETGGKFSLLLWKGTERGEVKQGATGGERVRCAFRSLHLGAKLSPL